MNINISSLILNRMLFNNLNNKKILLLKRKKESYDIFM